MDRWSGGDYACSFILLMRPKLWLLWHLEFLLAYNGKSGFCNNLKTACSFLMKLAIWIDSKMEIMRILLLCLPNINFDCYGNLKLPLAYNERM